MDKKILQTAFGALLQIFIPISLRAGEAVEYIPERLQNRENTTDRKIIECFRFASDCPQNSPSFAINFAQKLFGKFTEKVTDKSMNSLLSICNLLCGRSEGAVLPHFIKSDEIPYPIVATDNTKWTEKEYAALLEKLEYNLSQIEFSDKGINMLLSVEKKLLSGVPAQPECMERADVSLYDYSSLLCAVSCCVSKWINENYSVDNSLKNLRYEKIFLLYSCDFSGIQNFIFQVNSDQALKSLRTRSFYLEIFMEYITDEILSNAGLSRANLLYVGGGHCYILLPNTEKIIDMIQNWTKQINGWLFDKFGTLLYLAPALVPCSGSELINEPSDNISSPYTELYHVLSQQISKRKIQRYSAEELVCMNKKVKPTYGQKECSVCGRIDTIIENKCPLCKVFADMSGSIMKEDSTFLILTEKPKWGPSLPLPSYGTSQNVWLCAVSEENVEAHIGIESVRNIYVKNRLSKKLPEAVPFEMGDYCKGDSIDAFAEGRTDNEKKRDKGITRLGVLRLDVDNLGAAFMNGFVENEFKKMINRETIFRTVSFSELLTRFFKYDINKLLNDENYNVEIIYSGGDDVFLIGYWADVIKTAQCIHYAFKEYTLGRLTISGGIGLTLPRYPIYNASNDTAELEEAAKDFRPEKDAVSLFAKEYTFSWDDFTSHVLNEKLKVLTDFFQCQSESEIKRGNSFLYCIMELLRGQKEHPINKARYVYLLARMEPAYDSHAYVQYKDFSAKMYSWCGCEEDRRQLITAIYIFIYLHRNEREENE